MAHSDLAQVLQQIAFIGAVLSGFSVTLFVSMLSTASNRRISAYAAGTALVATSLLIIATIAGVAGVVSILLGSEPQSAVHGSFNWAAFPFLVGMFLFLVSLGLSGWVRSRTFGIASTSITGVAIVTLLYFLTAVVEAI